MNSMGKDLAAQMLAAYAVPSTSATAGGGGDGAEVSGATIDITALASRPASIAFLLFATATLQATETLALRANLQDSADGSSWADITTPAVLLTLTGAPGGSTETGAAKLGFDFTKARQYVRIQFTPDLSASDTDTCVISGGAVAAALDRI